VRITSIAAGGDGVARIGDLACFVPRTAPADLAQIAYVTHARYARGRVLQLLESSPTRVEPRCRHYVVDRCGGCQLQHLSASDRHAALQQIVEQTLSRVGRRQVSVPEIVSDVEFGYRDRLTLALRRKGNGWVGGLHAYDDPGRVFALDECPIAHPALVEAWRAVRTALRGLPEPTAAGALRMAFRLVQRDGDASRNEPAAMNVAMVVLGGSHWPDAAAWAAAAAAAAPQVHSIWWERDGGESVRLFGDAAADVLAFAQINARVAHALRDHVLSAVLNHAPRTVIDAYSGQGMLSVLLAQRGIAVTAIESDARATAACATRLREYEDSRAVTALVEDAMTAVLPADVVVLNPPRRGIDPRVAAALASADSVRAIVYVSCDPATLARDLSRLPRWQIRSLQCFDMFPQTAHVETVCVLTPEEP